MATAENLENCQASEWALLRRHAEERCFGVQITSGNPRRVAHVCELLTTHCDVDFVDINMGCPIDCICKSGAGASLMTKPAKMQGVVEAALAHFEGSVTFKLRTGWKDDTPIAHTLVGYAQHWAARYEPSRVAAVFVHGRSRTARYSRSANWDYIQHVASSQDDSVPKLNVVGNGDVFSYADYAAKLASAPDVCPTAMLARGVLIKPWLPTEIKEQRAWDISAAERLEVLRDFSKFGLDHWGADDCGVARTRRFLLEWLSFLCRYTPVGLLEVLPQRLNDRPPPFVGRNDLETLMASPNADDWLALCNMVLPPAPDTFVFVPKHKSNAYAADGQAAACANTKAHDWG